MQIKLLKFKRSFRKSGLKSSPEFLWNMLLLLAFVIISTGAVYGFFLFRKVNIEATPNRGGDVINREAVSKDRINKSLEYFSNRKEKSDKILSLPSPIVDPSL